MEVLERKLYKYMMIMLEVVVTYGWMAALVRPSTVEERRLVRVLASLTVK
jgi:hypothetical protein